MRAVLVLLAVPLLAGCFAVSPQVVTAPQQVENAERAAGAADRLGAASSAGAVASLAQLYVLENGSTAGFASSVRSSEPALVADALRLSDSEVVYRISEDVCLYQPLPSGATFEAAC